MKISDIQVSDLKAYANVYTSEDDALFSTILIAARLFVKSYTGLSDADLDLYEDLTMAVFILSNDLYDNRSNIIDSRVTINPTVSALLNIHSVNFL